MRPNRLHKLTIICWARLTLCALLVILWSRPCFAVTDTLREIAHKGSNSRITHEFPLLTDVKWDIVVSNSNGQVRNITGAIFDTVSFDDPRQLNMTTKFAVAPALFKKPLMLRYECAGSIVIKINDQILARTGRYDTSAGKKDEVAKTTEFALWVPRDSLVRVEVTYTPPAKIGTCAISEISLVETEAYERNIQANNSSIKSSYALGFYYLAFGIVFLILFLNFRGKQEYLFFALFSIAASLSWLVGTFDNRLIAESSIYAVILALEFLAMVLARVMIDRNRSLVPLAVIVGLILLSYTPIIHESYIHVYTQYLPIYKIGLGTSMMFYCGLSAIYWRNNRRR